jgi:hypothetical protein
VGDIAVDGRMILKLTLTEWNVRQDRVLFLTTQRTAGFRKRRGFSWPNERQLASQKGLCSMGLVIDVVRVQDGAGIAQRCSAGLRAGWSGVQVPAGAGNFSPYHRVQTGSETHPGSYPMGIGSKAAEVWSWPFTSIWCRGQECMELYFHLPPPQ